MPKKSKSTEEPSLSFEQSDQEIAVVRAVVELKQEADDAKGDRLAKNKTNWDLYHGRGKSSKKQKGQSKEFLHKNAMAAEQITSLFKSSLVNFDKWIDVEWVGDDPDPLFTPKLAKALLRIYFEYCDMKTVISDTVKVALHEANGTIKLVGQKEVVPRYVSIDGKIKKRDLREWRLRPVIVPAEDYFPDPAPTHMGRLYEIHQMLLDRHLVLDMASEGGSDPEKPFILEKVRELPSTWVESEDAKARNRGESYGRNRASRRKPILLDEFWGTVIGEDGQVLKWKREDGTEFELKNVLLVVANERVLVQEPIENPRWAASSPFVTAPILRVPFATWSKAIMDAAASLNITLNELFNLMLDGGLSAVHGIKALREDWLTPECQDEIADSIPSGTTLILNNTAPADAASKAMARVDTGSVPPDVLSFFHIVNQLYAENALSNEIKLGGMPQKQVRATEVVASGQSISGIFDGLASDFEDVFVEKLAAQSWMDILQNVHRFPKNDLKRIIGEGAYNALNALTPSQRFERAGAGFKWKGKGIRTMMQRMQDFQKIVQVLAIVSQNPLLLDEFRMKYSMPRFLGKLMRSIEIDAEELELTDTEKKAAELRQKMQQAMIESLKEDAGAEGGGTKPGEGPGKTAPNPENMEAPANEGTVPGSGAGLVQ